MLATVGFIDLLTWTLLICTFLVLLVSAPTWAREFIASQRKEKPMSLTVSKAESVESSVLCPFCRDAISSKKKKKVCDDCGTEYHKACFKELGNKKCPIRGCSSTNKRVRL